MYCVNPTNVVNINKETKYEFGFQTKIFITDTIKISYPIFMISTTHFAHIYGYNAQN